MNLFRKLNLSETTKNLLSNFTYLSIIEVIGILLPLLSYPYLIRTIGAEYYGIVVFAQAIVAYIIIVVNFGFNVSATRRVSENRESSDKLRIIYSSIIYLKSLLLILCFLATLFILKIIHYDHMEVVVFLMGLCIQEVLFPTWLFQGLENMKFITIITFASKCSYLVLIFIFIHTSSDYIYVPILYSFGGVLTSVMSMVILKKKFNIYLTKVNLNQLKTDFVESLPFFSSRLSTVIMERTNVILIGSFFSYDMVSVYDLCVKIVSIVKTPFSLVAQVLYPSVARSKNMKLVKNIIRPLVISSLLASLIIGLGARFIINILGGAEMIDAVPILQIMIWYVPFVGLSYLFGASVLVVMRHSKEYNLSVIYSVFFYLIFTGVIVIFDLINLYTMALSFILPEIFVSVYRIYITKKYNLLK